MIRRATINDAKNIVDIYNYYVDNSIATFDENHVSIKAFQTKIKTAITKLPWFVFEYGNEIIGYAYADYWNKRSAYNKTAEVSVYLKHTITQRGIGTKLYKALIDELINMNYHTIIGGISLPNESSVRLHEKFGFEKVAHFMEVGFKFDKWVDVGYWQLIIDKNKI